MRADPVADRAADLIARLGVPPERIWTAPPPGTATEQDVLHAHDHLDRLCELVDGVLVEKAPSYRASLPAAELICLLGNFVRSRNLGLVSGAGSLMRLMAGLVRIPDVAFVRWDRVPGGAVPDAPIPGLVPNLAVEVLSPSNTPAEMARKRQEYFGASVELVWVIDPAARTAEVFTAPDRSVVLDAGQTLDGGPVLPGFALPLAHLFAELDRRPSP